MRKKDLNANLKNGFEKYEEISKIYSIFKEKLNLSKKKRN